MHGRSALEASVALDIGNLDKRGRHVEAGKRLSAQIRTIPETQALWIRGLGVPPLKSITRRRFVSLVPCLANENPAEEEPWGDSERRSKDRY